MIRQGRNACQRGWPTPGLAGWGGIASSLTICGLWKSRKHEMLNLLIPNGLEMNPLGCLNFTGKCSLHSAVYTCMHGLYSILTLDLDWALP